MVASGVIGVCALAAHSAMTADASPVVGQTPRVGKSAGAPLPPASQAPVLSESPKIPGAEGQTRIDAWDAAALVVALALSASSLVIIRRRRLLRLGRSHDARDPSGLPAAVWLTAALAAYIAWLAGASLSAAAARELWPAHDSADLRTTASVALGAYALAGVAIVVAGIALRAPMSRAGLWRAPSLRDVATALATLALVMPVIFLLLMLGGLLETLSGSEPDPVAHDTLRVLRQTSPASLWWWGVVAGAVVFAPLFEEWLYRGFVQTALRALTTSPWIAVVATAFVFTLAHAGSVGADARTLPALFTLGIALGVLLERSGSLWPCVIAHALFNALNVALALAIR